MDFPCEMSGSAGGWRRGEGLGGGGGLVVYQYTRRKFAKIPKINGALYTSYLKFKESDTAISIKVVA